MNSPRRAVLTVSLLAGAGIALGGLPVQAAPLPVSGALAAPAVLAAKSQPKRSMKVTITGLPAGVSGSVTVKGPKGFKKRTLKATALLKKLPTGRYKISARSVDTTSGAATATVSKPKVKVKKSSRLKVKVTYVVPTPVEPTGQAIAQAITGPGVTIKNPVYKGSAQAQGAISGVFSAPIRSTRNASTEAWLLSTGLVDDALKDPPLPGDEYFASHEFGLPGDDTLASLLPPGPEGTVPSTYDAAFVTFDVTPQGSRLDIRYRFASEEYPEYVGSEYNDVMGIFVNGVNCATVPGPGGTQLAVAVNSVNSGYASIPATNPDLHMDNLLPPYKANTSYDGFTVPLTCSVATTPGTPVQVKIGVADTSDGEWDTAVALLNGGVSSS